MNAYEIEQIEKDVRANFRLPLSYSGWADIERQARQERARVLGQGFSRLVAAVWVKVVGFGRATRSNAASCTDARLNHS
jgi:hypothetical protein